MAKRRPSGDGMVRKRDDGRWEGRIVVGHKENGDSIFRYVYAPTQKELSAKLRQHIDSYQGADLTEQGRMTLSEWLDQWLEDMADTLRPNTLRNYCSYIENHIRPGLGNKQLSRITPKDVQRFYEKLSDRLASGTVRRIHTTLHGTLKAAQQAHLIASNPTEQITAPRFSYGAKQILTDKQLDVFMKVIAEDEIWCDFFYTELTTGLRRGEICGLKWEDFDEVTGTLKVCRTVYRETGGGLTAGDTKTNAGTRKIVLPASTTALLSKKKASALTEWIFPNPLKPEQPTNPGSAYRQLKVLLKQAGLPNIRFHDLRHTLKKVVAIPREVWYVLVLQNRRKEMILMAKRRPSGDGMVRKRDDGRWEGRIVVGHKENGDSIFRYVYAPTQKELSAKLRQHIDSYQGADLTEQSRMTLSEWLDKWLENMADTLRPNTLRNYRSYIENHIRPSLGDKQLARLTPKDIQRFYEKLGGSLASGTVRRIHTTLHGTLKAAQQAHLIASNPTEQITAPKFSYGAKQILTDEQLDVFMKVIAEDEIWYDFFYAELTTGLRRGEICGLKWEDFDEVNGTLKVCRTVYWETGGGLTAGDTKTSAGVRKIVLPASTVQVLRERKKSALTEWIFPNPLKPEQPTNPGAAYRQLKALLKRAGLPNIRFHDLRHTFATHALASGVDVKTLSGILGHTRAAFTLDTYTHTTGDMQKRASEVVGNFLTDIFGEELRPWEESARAARVQSV